MDMLRRLIAQYSKDNSGVLNAEELARLVKSYSDTRQWTIEPANPTTEEMSWIERAAGKSIDENRLELALELWRSYITNRAGIERVFAKYDTDRSNLLEFHELKSYLADLSLGHPPAVSAQPIQLSRNRGRQSTRGPILTPHCPRPLRRNGRCARS
mmetsp:Transcript_67489/g.180323  ORF Transcript_67489/g.180323 Transcript_67489/m.180323 type:complete len:156 (+) Transcript_67489:193-660(+)